MPLFGTELQWLPRGNQPTSADAISQLVSAIQGRRDNEQEAKRRAAMVMVNSGGTEMPYEQKQALMRTAGIELPDMPPAQQGPPAPTPDQAQHEQERQDQADQAVADQYNHLSLAQQKVAYQHLPPGVKRLVPDPSTIPDVPPAAPAGPKPMTPYQAAQVKHWEESRGKPQQPKVASAPRASTKPTGPEAHAIDLEKRADQLEQKALSLEPGATQAKASLMDGATQLRASAHMVRQRFGAPAPEAAPQAPAPAAPQAPAAPTPMQAGPQVGDRKKFPNGKTGEWDGHGWALVQ